MYTSTFILSTYYSITFAISNEYYREKLIDANFGRYGAPRSRAP